VKFKNIKIVFMGTAEFGIPTLKILNKIFNLDTIITNYDKPSGRGQKIRFSAVKKYAITNNINLLQPKNLKDEEFVKNIQKIKPDFIVVVAFRMIPKIVWEIPKYGTINLHASLLPDYRGSAPINWVIMNNEKVTGVTTFFIDDKIDTGDILLQERIKIDKKINAGELHDKLKLIGASIVEKTLKGILKNSIQSVKQTQKNSFNTAYKFDKKNIKIDWNQNCLKIYNKIRGLSPYPGAKTSLVSKSGETVNTIFYQSEYLVEKHNHNNGKIIHEKGKIKITCKNGYLIIKNLKIEGKKRMDTESFLNGFKIEKYEIVK
jgi:methionyl-tRNA formyltransferase